MLGDYLGFSEVTSAKYLGIDKTPFMNPSRSAQCYLDVIHKGSMSNRCLTSVWNEMHKPNSMLLLLDEHKAVGTLGVHAAVQVQECGVCHIPPSDVLPELTIAPDGILSCLDAEGKVVKKVVVHLESFLPFAQCEQGNSFAYTSHREELNCMIPHHYAACQLSMQAHNLQECLLLVYGPQETQVLSVSYNPSWVTCMLSVASTLHTSLKSANTIPAVCFSSPAYLALLQITLDSCRQCFKSMVKVHSKYGPVIEPFILG